MSQWCIASKVRHTERLVRAFKYGAAASPAGFLTLCDNKLKRLSGVLAPEADSTVCMSDGSVSTFATAWDSALVMALMTMTADPVGIQSVPWWVKQFFCTCMESTRKSTFSIGMQTCRIQGRNWRMNGKRRIDVFEFMACGMTHEICVTKITQKHACDTKACCSINCTNNAQNHVCKEQTWQNKHCRSSHGE